MSEIRFIRRAASDFLDDISHCGKVKGGKISAGGITGVLIEIAVVVYYSIYK